MTAKRYVEEIVQRTCLPYGERKRLRQDLLQEIEQAVEGGEYLESVMERMGAPHEVARGICENRFGIDELPYEEYRSETEVFGLPLLHIVRMRPQYSMGASTTRLRPPQAHGFIAMGRRAKGFIALGNIARGFIALGNLAIGLLVFANLGLGMLALGNGVAGALAAGNVAVSAASAGNVAVGALAAGNVAVGYGAMGNVAAGKYALGGAAARGIGQGGQALQAEGFAAQMEEVTAFVEGSGAPQPVREFLLGGAQAVANLSVADILWIVLPVLLVPAFALLLWLIVSQKTLGKPQWGYRR